MTMPTTLITGATGFLGGQVAAAWVDQGHSVRCTVRATSDASRLNDLGVELAEWDVHATEGVRSALEGIDTVVHVAGITRAPRETEYFQVNATGAGRLAEAAASAGVRRFVLVSSLAARGPDGGTGPISAYGASKLRGEELVRLFEEKMEIVILRPGGIYGPRDTDMFPLFESASRGWLVAPAGGPPLQPIYVTDAASLTVAAGTAPHAIGPFPVAEEGQYEWTDVRDGLAAALDRQIRIVSLPATVFISIGAVAETAARLLRKDPPLDKRNAIDLSRHGWTCDTAPTRETFGWRTEVALPEGLAKTVRWYRDAGWL
jgi:nucleoside-diphosphate-sugar epimerase